MNFDDDQLLNAFLEQIHAMKLQRSGTLGSALKKPLLVLLLVSRIENDRVEENRFHFDDIEQKLASLIREHGGRPTPSGPKPEQPFSHLRTSPFWNLTTQRGYTSGKTALVSDLRNPNSFGAFDPNIFRLLRSSAVARAQVVDAILDEWWPATLHSDIREDLGLERLDGRRSRQRDKQFTIDVLENFRYSCAFCGFHALLNKQATGIDAAHVHWHAHHGPDDVSNGLALCKLHHWAFDKGILGIDESEKVCVADAFITHTDGGLPIASLSGCIFAVLPQKVALSKQSLEWHRDNVYLGT